MPRRAVAHARAAQLIHSACVVCVCVLGRSLLSISLTDLGLGVVFLLESHGLGRPRLETTELRPVGIGLLLGALNDLGWLRKAGSDQPTNGLSAIVPSKVLCA